MDRVRSLRKILTRLRGSNICNSSARFAPSFVRQPNCSECTQMVQNAQTISLGSNELDQVRSLRKILMWLRGTTFFTARFAPSFVRQPNGHECTQIVQNARKHQFTVQWVGSNAFIAKNSDATSWLKLLHYFGPFCTEFRMTTKRSRMHPYSTNAPKRQFRVTWGGLHVFVAKNSDVTSWHKVFALAWHVLHRVS